MFVRRINNHLRFYHNHPEKGEKLYMTTNYTTIIPYSYHNHTTTILQSYYDHTTTIPQPYMFLL